MQGSYKRGLRKLEGKVESKDLYFSISLLKINTQIVHRFRLRSLPAWPEGIKEESWPKTGHRLVELRQHGLTVVVT